MQISIDEVKKLSLKILQKLGFSDEEAELITKNVLEGELSGRKSHGLNLLLSIKRFLTKPVLKHGVVIDKTPLEIIKETPNSLYLDGKFKAGFYVIYKSLEKAIPKAKRHGMVSVGIKNAGYATGFIGAYAREAAQNNLIFLGFHSTFGDMFPHGSNKPIFGTNPLTIGIPSLGDPVILDMASSKITIGGVVIARNEGQKLKEGVGQDASGNPTTDPLKVLSDGGVLPIAGHKGSGLAFVIELLGGALTGSAAGFSVPGGWGSFYILINPELFRPIDAFKKDVKTAIDELKHSPKAKGFQEILYPGEQSAKTRKKNLKKGSIEISDTLLQSLKEMLV